MKSIKKILAGVLAGTMMLGMSACQQETKTEDEHIKIGVIQFAEHGSLDNCYTGFLLGLEEQGYEEGKNITVDYQVAQADMALSNQIAANFVSKGYDLIVGIATPAAQAAYNEAQKAGIPVIFNAVTDPIAAGLQNEDGSNKEGITGTSDVLPVRNQLALIRAFQPEAKRIGILYTLAESNSVASIEKYQALAPEFGFEIITQSISESQDVPQAAQSLVSKVDAVSNLTDNTVVQNLPVVLQRTNQASIPYYGSEEEQVALGLVAAEGIDYIALGKTTGQMAADIFSGKKSEELPVVIAEDSTPFYNSEALENLELTLPEQYAHAKDMANKE